MTVQKIIAIICIFAATAIAWMILGAGTASRTDDSFASLKNEVASLYGSNLWISSPRCYTKAERSSEEIIDGKTIVRKYLEEVPFDLVHSNININVINDRRKKGNLWFPTFKIQYSADYIFDTSDRDIDNGVFLYSVLSSEDSVYDDIGFSVNGIDQNDISFLVRKKELQVFPDEKGKLLLSVSYNATGMEQLSYFLSDYEQISHIKDFTLVMETNFRNVDFPSGMMSPVSKTETESGYELKWRLENSVTGKDIGLIIPNKLNPGEIVTRVTFFAPVPLLFFFTVLLVISVILKVPLHPMHFAFLAATFFSFHLMYSYFSDHLNLYLTFGISSVVSLILTITYLRLFTPRLIAWLLAPAIQLLYLVVFSFSFFFDGTTGVIVTICSVITLFVIMQITGKIDWDKVFNKETESQSAD